MIFGKYWLVRIRKEKTRYYIQISAYADGEILSECVCMANHWAEWNNQHGISHFFQSLFHISNIVKIPLLCQRLPDDVFLKLCFDIVMAAFSVIVHEGVSLEIFIDKLNAEQERNDL